MEQPGSGSLQDALEEALDCGERSGHRPRSLPEHPEHPLTRSDRTFAPTDRYRCPAVCRGVPGVACAPIRSEEPAHQMATATQVESFCESCGTRYAFEPRRPRGRHLMRVGRLVGILADDADIDSSALVVSRDPFHGAFHFCLECRRFTCPSCWDASAGFCRSCAMATGSSEDAQAEDTEPDPETEAILQSALASLMLAGHRRGVAAARYRRPRRAPKIWAAPPELVEAPEDDLSPMIEAGLAVLGAKALADAERAQAEAEQRRLAEELRLEEERLVAEQAEQLRAGQEAEQARLAWEAEQARLAWEAEQARLRTGGGPEPPRAGSPRRTGSRPCATGRRGRAVSRGAGGPGRAGSRLRTSGRRSRAPSAAAEAAALASQAAIVHAVATPSRSSSCRRPSGRPWPHPWDRTSRQRSSHRSRPRPSPRWPWPNQPPSRPRWPCPSRRYPSCVPSSRSSLPSSP